jgi:hypothetical protein
VPKAFKTKRRKKAHSYNYLPFPFAEASKQLLSCIGFEVLTAVVIKSIIFWNMTPCSPLRFKLATYLLPGF